MSIPNNELERVFSIIELEEQSSATPGPMTRGNGCTCISLGTGESDDGVFEMQHAADCLLYQWRQRRRSGRLLVFLVRDLPRPSLLPDRSLTPEERAAHDEDPRPGVWAGEPRADLRALTQEETDQLIRAELCDEAPLGERDEVAAVIGGYPGHRPVRVDQHARAARQRGGIDSDPLVRLLAFRAWGDRDRQWFDLRGVRKGEAVAFVATGNPLAYVALRYEDESTQGVGQNDARPGETVTVDPQPSSYIALRATQFRVSDRLREEQWRHLPDSRMRSNHNVQRFFDDVIVTRIEPHTITLARPPIPQHPTDKPTPPVPPWALRRRRKHRSPSTRR